MDLIIIRVWKKETQDDYTFGHDILTITNGMRKAEEGGKEDDGIPLSIIWR